MNQQSKSAVDYAEKIAEEIMKRELEKKNR